MGAKDDSHSILFTIDNVNFINANEIVLLNGFIKKSTTDYENKNCNSTETNGGLFMMIIDKKNQYG
jgi:hypothetical protein